ncbi:hypothetical protein PR202_gb16829 [Eleusine coracana subsp. coracana]|uniref:PGG domain-containing protein n=1 Tax=Eleusine coracana subsp. coracana TaxID=191504 RepID=A0AAV5EZ28_ELECO|nr:hypothetical protein PR202_gb16829 [Eleusine coracana subsp. coracana]
MRQHGRCNLLELSVEGNTILHVAAEHGHCKLIQELCLRFKDTAGKVLLPRRNSALDTPLHCAVRRSNKQAVKILVQQLAMDCGEVMSVVVLGYKNEAGDTALHLAARHGHGQAVEVLVAAAPAVTAELNDAGVSPLYLAVMSGSVKAVRAIITSSCRDDASAAGPSDQNALHPPCFSPPEMVELLLKWRPALANEVDSNGSTPLHFASSDGDHSVVRTILRAAPLRTAYRKDHAGGLSALHVASRMGHDRVVKEILKSCPDAAELRDEGGGTFLHAAAREKRSSVVALAVKDPKLRRILLNAQDGEGNTPLHVAVAAGAPRVVETLLRKGKIRADVLNNAGHTAFDLVAESTSYFTMVSLVVMLVAFKAQHRPQRQDHVKPWNCTGVVQRIEKTSDSLAVVAVLIAAAAFAAGFNLPGGYGDDGTPNLMGKPTFQYFLALLSIAAGTSVVAAILLVYGKSSSSIASCKSFVVSLHCMWVSLISLMLAFCMALFVMASSTSRVYYIMSHSSIYIQFLILWIMAWFTFNNKSPSTNLRFLWQSCCRSKGRRVIERQYPLAGASIIPKSFLYAVALLVMMSVSYFLS